MIGKIKEVVIESEAEFKDYYPYMRTIGQKIELTKFGEGEVIACEIFKDKIITTVKITSVSDLFLNNIDVYPIKK